MTHFLCGETMNKALRKDIERRKWQRRCEAMGIDIGSKTALHYKAQGKPCSCEMCTPYRYIRAQQKDIEKEFESVLIENFWELV